MYKTQHFVTGSFVSHAKFVDDATYSTILDNVVKATCDIFMVHMRKPQKDDESPTLVPHVLLGKRVGLPHNDWWIPGGRMMPGEQAALAAGRLLKRELGVHFAPKNLDLKTNAEAKAILLDRFSTIAHFTFVWDTRTQEPITNGTCDVSIIMTVDTSDEEAGSVLHKKNEYTDLQWVPVPELVADIRSAPASELATSEGETDVAAIQTHQTEVVASVAKEEPVLLSEEPSNTEVPKGRKLHPALRAGLLELDAKMKFDALKKKMASGAGDGAVVEALKEFMAAKGEKL